MGLEVRREIGRVKQRAGIGSEDEIHFISMLGLNKATPCYT